MTKIKMAAFSVAMLAANATLGLPANAMPASKMSNTDMMASCKAMPHDKMMADAMCMKMMHVSSKEMKTMKSCQAMDHDMMMKNKGCMKVMKMHPNMMGDGMMKK